MADEHPLAFTIVDSTYVIDDRYLRLRRDRLRLADGRIIEPYYVREARGFAIVAALTPENEIVLVREYKHGVGKVVVGMPAGSLDPGESPAACAERELAEETGYTGDPPQLLHELDSDPTSSTSRYGVFLIRNARRTTEQRLDDAESIVVFTVSLDEFARMVRDGRIGSGHQVAAGYIALEALARSSQGIAEKTV